MEHHGRDWRSDFSVKRVNYHKVYNGLNHSTEEYETPQLVIRRGQPFNLDIVLHTMRFSADNIFLFMEVDTYGHKRENDKEHPLRYELRRKSSLSGVKDWAFELESVMGDTVKLRVMTPVDAVVARYKLEVWIDQERGPQRVHSDDKYIYLLFNAWCKDDDVYVEDEKERHEYVLEDKGMIWKSKRMYSSRFSWNFAQFDEGVLECAMYLLYKLPAMNPDKFYLFNSPIWVCRILSGNVNCAGIRDGVLVGNWSGDYEGGTSPSVWTGSAEILTQFLETEEPVKYGQCWVFSGVYTTVCRALGIPTRSVTNFSSAHDTDGSCTIDKVYEKDGTPSDTSNDSIWNFHVWNECWFKRNDTGPEYHGWQALDSTPQEYTRGAVVGFTMACGPAPVNAIKRGDLHIGHDTRFIFSEVAGDVVYWELDENREKIPLRVETTRVGNGIYTKAVGSSLPVDLNPSYKSEGEEGYNTMAKALSCGMKNKFLSEAYARADWSVDANILNPGEAFLGDNINFTLQLKNKSKERLTVSMTTTVKAAYYHGPADKSDCHRETLEVILTPLEVKDVTIELSPDEYYPFMRESDTILKVTFHGNIKETGQTIIDTREILLDAPEMEMEIMNEQGQPLDDNKVSAFDDFMVKVSFMNAFKVDVTGALEITGGEIKRQKFKELTVPALSMFEKTYKVTPRLGLQERKKGSLLSVSFFSKCMSPSCSKTIKVIRS